MAWGGQATRAGSQPLLCHRGDELLAVHGFAGVGQDLVGGVDGGELLVPGVRLDLCLKRLDTSPKRPGEHLTSLKAGEGHPTLRAGARVHWLWDEKGDPEEWPRLGLSR